MDILKLFLHFSHPHTERERERENLHRYHLLFCNKAGASFWTHIFQNTYGNIEKREWSLFSVSPGGQPFMFALI